MYNDLAYIDPARSRTSSLTLHYLGSFRPPFGFKSVVHMPSSDSVRPMAKVLTTASGAKVVTSMHSIPPRIGGHSYIRIPFQHRPAFNLRTLELFIARPTPPIKKLKLRWISL